MFGLLLIALGVLRVLGGLFVGGILLAQNIGSVVPFLEQQQVALYIVSDIVIVKTSMYAHYIVPDLTFLERWGMPHPTPDNATKVSKIRQPVGKPLTEEVTVGGEKMPIITVSRGSYSRGKEVAHKVAERLGYECLSREILLEASKEFNVEEVKLERAIQNAPSFLERISFGKERYIAYIRAALLAHRKQDNVV